MKEGYFYFLLNAFLLQKINAQSCSFPNLPLHSKSVTPRQQHYPNNIFFHYKCDGEYLFSSGDEDNHKIQCVNGAWEPKAMWKCIDKCRNKCGSHGKCVTTLGKDESETVSMCHCERGYGGETCQAKICEVPDISPHGFIQLIKGRNISNKFVLASELMYACDRGYVIRSGRTKIVCEHEGWIPSAVPVCEEIKCINPLATDSYIPYKPMKLSYDVGDKVTFDCERHYPLSSHSTSMCLWDGSWSNTWPLCKKRYCENPSDVLHGFKETTLQNFPIGSLVRYSCITGYKILTNSVIRCVQGGEGLFWSASLPECVSWHTYCNQINKIVVQRGGKYSCEDKKVGLYCENPSDVLHGFKETTSQNFPIGSLVRYSCITGYKILTDSEIQCVQGRNGLFWSASLPQCVSWYTFCNRINKIVVQRGGKYSCEDKKVAINSSAEQSGATQPLTIVTGTAGGLLLLLLLLITVVACQRRLAQRRQRMNTRDSASFFYYSNDVHVVLPSYDEAMQSRRPLPPPYIMPSEPSNAIGSTVNEDNAYITVEEFLTTADPSTDEPIHAQVQRETESDTQPLISDN